MAYKLIFKKSAIEDLDKIDNKSRERIIKKLEWFINSEDPLFFVVQLTNPIIGEYRFRIGIYRVIFDCKKSIVIILRIGHRSNIYK